MRIELESYPLVKSIWDGRVHIKHHPQGNFSFNKFMDLFNERYSDYGKDIKFISQGFYDSFILGFDKFNNLEMINEFVMTKRNFSGTILFNGVTIFYCIDSRESEYHFSQIECVGDNVIHVGHQFNDQSIYEYTSPDSEQSGKQIESWIVILLLFLEYCPIETKVLPPNRQIMDGVTCRYNNKLPLPIQIIDSTWFTTLVKSDAFKVRGHFRLQPYGEGMSKRKLIWINDFQKEGYTREAKKLKE